jgi:hypothetical protein
MFTIYDSHKNSSSAATANSSDMSIASSDESLVYVEPKDLPSPKLCAIHLEDITKPTPFLPPPAFTPNRPCAVEIRTETFSDAHRSREVQAKDSAAEKATDPRPAAAARTQQRDEAEALAQRIATAEALVEASRGASRPLKDVCRSLAVLYHYAQTVKDSPQVPEPVDDEDPTEASSISGWNDDDDEEYRRTYPTPDTSPIQNDEPQWGPSGTHPGIGWHDNLFGTTRYYRFLIPEPSTNKSIDAPYIAYSMSQVNPTVSATFGDGYPVYKRSLRAVPVEYHCPPLTDQQVKLLDPEAPYATAIYKVIKTYFPLHLLAGIREFHYYKDLTRSIDATIQHLNAKAEYYAQKTTELDKELAQANVMGRLLVHYDELTAELPVDDNSEYLFARILADFEGAIPQTAIDPTINPYRSAAFLARERASSEERNHIDVEARLRTRLRNERGRAWYRPPVPVAYKRCYRCHKEGHIEKHCPQRASSSRK